MIPSLTPVQAAFHAFNKARSAAWLLDAASLDELNPSVKAKLEELAADLSRISNVVEVLAYAMKDQLATQVH